MADGAAQGDLYQLLGVSRRATAAQIRRAYHQLAERWHPDRVPPAQRAEAAARFQAITAAYNVLKDRKRRAAYNRGGLAALPDVDQLVVLLDLVDHRAAQGIELLTQVIGLTAQARKVVKAVQELIKQAPW